MTGSFEDDQEKARRIEHDAMRSVVEKRLASGEAARVSEVRVAMMALALKEERERTLASFDYPQDARNADPPTSPYLQGIATVPAVPNTPGTPRRTIRVPDDLWEAAQAKASDRGENLSDVIRKALERYVRRTK